MDNRSMILCYYNKEGENGDFLFGYSSEPCKEDLAVKYKDRTKKDTVADAEFTIHVAPHEKGGTKLKLRIFMNPNGSIPGMLKTKMANKQQEALGNMADYVRKNC